MLESGNQKEETRLLEVGFPRQFKDFFKQLHNSPAAGHLFYNKPTERVKARFYWCGRLKDVESWFVHCDV